jgi:hypothetical protein
MINIGIVGLRCVTTLVGRELGLARGEKVLLF